MAVLFSPTTCGFYDPQLHAPASVPEDAVPISREEHAALLAGQAAGKRIIPGADGRPELADPPAPPPPPPVRRLAPLAFRRRFPPATRAAITLAAAQALAAGDPTLQVFLDDLAASRFVDLDAPETRAGVAAMVAAGLLTESEAAAVLADGTPDEAAGSPA